jgi:hypothetical protein
VVARGRYKHFLRRTGDAPDQLGTLKIQCGPLEVEAFQEEGQWVASVATRPELIAQSRTLEGVLRQVLEFESVFCTNLPS